MNTKRDQVLEADGLRVRFCWRGDRWAHEIWLRDGADWTRALESVEGSPQDEWPSSPPLQELHLERRDDAPCVALLVGMAGKCHWSASAQIDPAVPCVGFDVACRVGDVPCGPLGSTYQSSADCFPYDALDVEIDPRFGPLVIERKAESVKIAAGPVAASGAHTVRWAYRLVVIEQPPWTRL